MEPSEAAAIAASPTVRFGEAPSRFAPIPMESMSPEQRQVAQALIDSPRGGIRGPFHALLRNPRLTERVRAVGECIRFESTVAVELREFVILLVARHWSAHYEWHAHSLAAAKAGVRQDVIDAVGEGRVPAGMNADQVLLHGFCTQLLEHNDVSDATYAAAMERFGERDLLDLLCTAAYFSFVSLILNTVRHPVPAGGRPLPPRTAAVPAAA